MKQLIFDALQKVQELQRDLLNTNIDVDIDTYFDVASQLPWLSVDVATDGWFKLPSEEAEKSRLSENIVIYPHYSERVNRAIVEDQIEKIVNFAKTLSNEN